MSLPNHFLRVGGEEKELAEADVAAASLRRQIEPWLAAVFQSEHLSLLVGNGLTAAVARRCHATAPSMDAPPLKAPHADKVQERAERLAKEAQRGTANIEDQLRAALQLVAGLEVLQDSDAEQWKLEISGVLDGFVASIVDTERQIAASIESGESPGTEARNDLVSFLVSFASRTSSRERLNIFTTNYDRLIEFGCDLVADFG